MYRSSGLVEKTDCIAKLHKIRFELELWGYNLTSPCDISE